MAEFSIAVGKTLLSEGGFSLNTVTGECVNFGITVWFLRAIGVLPARSEHTASASEVAFVRSLTKEYAISLYRRYFWDALGLDLIRDQVLANRIFDLTVNQGAGGVHAGKVVAGGVTLLQMAVNSLAIRENPLLRVDGLLGANTRAAVNRCPPGLLLTRYRAAAATHYREIARAQPALAANLPGWLARLQSA